MSDAHHDLTAYRWTVAAIVAIVLMEVVLIAIGRTVEGLVANAAVTGLIGLARMPAARPDQVEVTNSPNDPVPTTAAGPPPDWRETTRPVFGVDDPDR